MVEWGVATNEGLIERNRRIWEGGCQPHDKIFIGLLPVWGAKRVRNCFDLDGLAQLFSHDIGIDHREVFKCLRDCRGSVASCVEYQDANQDQKAKSAPFENAFYHEIFPISATLAARHRAENGDILLRCGRVWTARGCFSVAGVACIGHAARMFEGFTEQTITVDGVDIFARIGGEGPPLLLLHGYPQTHVMWHKVVPELSKRFTCVCADLRGYGASAKPPTVEDHATYSKRAMAADMLGVMEQLGFRSFRILAHDRGARVAHRMAMDWPDRVERMVLLDIAPTREMYANTTDAFARTYWHWFFLIQPSPLPEEAILADPEAFVRRKCGSWGSGGEALSEEALQAYIDGFSDPETIRAACEDYRAAATIDIAHDDADGDRKVTCPVHVLWGAKGAIEAHFECLALWKQRVERVTGETIDCGHYLAEERPDDVLAQSIPFLCAD